MPAIKKSNEFIAFGWDAIRDGYEWIDAHDCQPRRIGHRLSAGSFYTLRPRIAKSEGTILFRRSTRSFARLPIRHLLKRGFCNLHVNTDGWAYKSGFSPRKCLPIRFRRKARSW